MTSNLLQNNNNYSNIQGVGWTLVRFRSLSDPVGKVMKTRVWETLFELVYHFINIENLYLIVEVERFKQTFRFHSLIYIYLTIIHRSEGE